MGVTIFATLSWAAIPPHIASAAVSVAQTYSDGTDDDQDDMCIWVHPDDVSRSTVIGSDKANGNLYVYDLDGSVVQTVAAGKPGNIDVRYGFQLGEECVDLIAFNARDVQQIHVYTVDPATRRLTRVDDGTIDTGSNYGFTLYRHTDGRLFAHTGPKSNSLITQYELFDDGTGKIAGTATGWQFQAGTIEGMVSDDENGVIFIGEEAVGIWRLDPFDDSNPVLVRAIGDASGLAEDVEGLTIYYAAGGDGYLIASSQGANKYTIVERRPPYAPVGEFQVTGVGSTDGIDVLNMNLNETFSQGIFTFHNGEDCCPVQAVKWADIVADVGGMLTDTDYWDPRQSNRSCGTTTTTTLEPPPDCGQPLSGSGRPTASDALYILQASVDLHECLGCVCDVDGTGTVTAGDALITLLASTNPDIVLNCPAC